MALVFRDGDFNLRELENKIDPNKNVRIKDLDIKDNMINCRMLSEVVIPVGGEIGFHKHIDECEYYIILSGEGFVTEDKNSYNVFKGDVVKTPSGYSHGIKNVGKDELKFIAVIITY